MRDRDRDLDRMAGLVTLNGFDADRATRIRLAEPADARHGELWEQVLSGTYERPIMVEDGRRRSLCFSIDGSVQSEMSLADPTELVNAYTREMMAFLLFCPRPADIVLVGLGGGSLAKFCYRHLPRTRLTAVEIDPAVIAMRRHFRVPPDDERLRVVEGDGGAFVAAMAAAGRRTDVLLVDAYDRQGMARSVCDRPFLEDACRVLSADGVLVTNLAMYESRRDAYLRQLRSVCGNPVLAVDVGWGGNTVAFAGPAVRSRRRLAAAAHYARCVEARLDLRFTRLSDLVEQQLQRMRPAGAAP